jgi:pyruvate/2-oxoglutarate dehydrogenase complex dihydrolipoamide acyltransferase (E2) component
MPRTPVLLAPAVLLLLPACSSPPTPSAAAPSATAASPAAASPAAAPSAATPSPVVPSASSAASPAPSQPATGRLPAADRAVQIRAVGGREERVLTVTADNRIATIPRGADPGDRELFTVAPIKQGGTTYLIRTAKLRTGGEPSCLTRKDLAVTLTACDAAAKAQTFQLVGTGRNGYQLVADGYNIPLDRTDKVVAAERGDSPATTTFTFDAV